ncbi:MAG: FHA domain-containing protein [Propionibacteriaceae bacterium]|nr:FHA domain-containing protein [Propionibacteriaceae bacterium]
MNDLIVATIKVSFLALLWLFILFVANVIRTDMFGRRVPTSDLPKLSGEARRGGKRRKNQPTKLVVTQGRQAGLEIPVEAVINLGRSADSTINLDDDYASTRHAQLVQEDAETWSVNDLQSTNGTFVNGVRVVTPVQIRIGDVIRIGRTQLKLDR